MISKVKAWFQRTFFGVSAEERVEPWVPSPEQLTNKIEPETEWPAPPAPQMTGPIRPSAAELGVCHECAQTLPTQEGRGRPRKYCSDKCSSAAYNRKRRDARAKEKAASISLTGSTQAAPELEQD